MKTATWISPFDAMWREVGCLYRALELARTELEKAVEGVASAAFSKEADPASPTIASLLLSCGAEEASWIHQRWRKAEVPRAPAVNAGKDAIVGWLREVREATRLALMKATDADLDRRTIASDDGPASLRWVLHRLLDRFAFTRGQVALLCALRK